MTVSGDEADIKFVTKGQGGAANVGARTYMMDPDSPDNYYMFKLKNREFTFDVDVSTLPCGLNGALYFVAMDADGGASKYVSKINRVFTLCHTFDRASTAFSHTQTLGIRQTRQVPNMVPGTVTLSVPRTSSLLMERPTY